MANSSPPSLADIMSERVVGLFEPIEIDQQQSESIACTPRRGQKIAEILCEPAPIGQRGQIVQVRDLLEAALAVAQLGGAIEDLLLQLVLPAPKVRGTRLQKRG